MGVDTQTIDLDDVYEGLDYNATFIIEDNKTPVDLDGYSFSVSAGKIGGANLVTAKNCPKASPTTLGKFVMSLDAAETVLFTNGDTIEYQIQGTSPAGEVEMYVTGRFVAKTAR